jgi:putative ABC transport system ATP-binding protein
MNLVRLRGIERTYDTGRVAVRALRGIDLDVGEGEFLAIMGPSGSGKSTLMNILGCLDQPTAGSYHLKGQDVARMKKGELARIRNQMLGFVFQAFHLLPRTSAQENVELPLLYRADELKWKEIHARARAALETVGLEDRLDHTPNELSGGQKQRVAIARALVTEPSVLLADEPTGNLDSRTTLEILDLIQGLNRSGLTILMVTHETDMARFAERTITLRDGLIVSDRRHTPLDAAKALAEWQDEEALQLEVEAGSESSQKADSPEDAAPGPAPAEEEVTA